MYRIASDELGEIIRILEERSPEALDKVRRRKREGMWASIEASKGPYGNSSALMLWVAKY